MLGLVRPLTALLVSALVALALMLGASGAQASARAAQRVSVRVPYPAAGNFSIAGFQVQVGPGGRRARPHRVSVSLSGHLPKGVFALARVVPERGHPGRLAGVLEVFRRAPTGAAHHARSAGFSMSATLSVSSPQGQVAVRVLAQLLTVDLLLRAGPRGMGAYGPFCHGMWISDLFAAGPALRQGFSSGTLPPAITARRLFAAGIADLCDDPPAASYVDILDRALRVSPAKPVPPPVPPTALTGSGSLRFFDPTEIVFTLSFNRPTQGFGIEVPGGRRITNTLAPPGYSNCAVQSWHGGTNNYFGCVGPLAANTQVQGNLQLSPFPTAGMGAQGYAYANGQWVPVFQFTGP